MNAGGILAGHVALISDQNRNIGRAIAIEFAKAGAAIVVNGHRDLSAIRRRGWKRFAALAASHRMSCGCVGPRRRCDEMVQEAASAFGKVDIAVSNVGIRNPVPFLELSEEEWDFTLRTNLFREFSSGAGNAALHGGAAMGRIIHIVGGSNFFAYTTAGLTASLRGRACMASPGAFEGVWGPRMWTVNTVAPGTSTPIATGQSFARRARQSRGEDPARPTAETDDIANGVFIFAAPGQLRSGQVLHVKRRATYCVAGLF